MTAQQTTTFQELMKLNTINDAAKAVLIVMKTFNTTNIEEVLPIITGMVNKHQKENIYPELNETDYKELTQGPGGGPLTWVITEDHGICNDCKNATQEQIEQIKKDGFTEHFKMFDDDGELYYSGYGKSLKDVDGFDPLDDFGMPNAGCTEIKYKNEKTGEFETL